MKQPQNRYCPSRTISFYRGFGGLFDEGGDFIGMRHLQQVPGIDFYYRCTGSLGHSPLELRRYEALLQKSVCERSFPFPR